MEREKAGSRDKWESGRISAVEKQLPETHERRRLCLFSVFGALSHRDVLLFDSLNLLILEICPHIFLGP